MQEIIIQIINTLKNDATLTAIIPATQIFVGPVDIVTQTQSGLQLPQINLHVISEVSRTVPSNVRDTMIQIDIWSRNSHLEVVNVYERILTLLNYLSGNQSTAHTFWMRLAGSVDDYESDRRIFHRSLTMIVWSSK
jgi:hypothetical protein